MGELTVEWTRVGPERPERIELPPVPMRLNGYVMAFDEKVGEIVFLTGVGYDGFGEAWSWNGQRWRQLHESKVRLDGEGEYQGYFDPVRGGIVALRFGYDHEASGHRPSGMLVTGEGSEALAMSGELPVGPDGYTDLHGAFGYDRSRDVGVCLTPKGVWELDAKGAWTKATDLSADDVDQEWKDAAGAVWDPVREVLLFWIYESDEYTHVFYEWDGAALTKAPTKGLPSQEEGVREFHIGLFNPSASFVGHPKHGVVLLDGSRFWRFDGKKWSPLPAAEDMPPRMTSGRLAYDPSRDTLLLGPGYHEGDGGGREMQQVFFELAGGAWKCLGVKMEDSPVTDLYGKHRYFVCGGVTHVIRLRGLHTYGWKDDRWQEVVTEEAGDEAARDQNVGAVLGMGEHAIAVLTDGTLCRFDGSRWTRTEETIPDFKERSWFTIARVGDSERLVIWGGDVKNRKSNDSFFRTDDGSWRKHKKASPRPKDFGHKHGPYVDFDVVWDSALERVVRVGWDECFTLEGEVWKAWEPKDFKEHAGPWRASHLPVHDRATGETLLVNLESRKVSRFDLERIVPVATLALPDDEIGPKLRHDPATWKQLDDDLWYEPGTRTLRAQFAEDKWAQYAWDLGPAFEAAAALGARTLLEAAAPKGEKGKKKGAKKAKGKATAEVPEEEPLETSARLYVIDERSRKLWYCDAEGSHLVRRWGRIGAKPTRKKEKKKSPKAAREAAVEAIAKKRADGYVDASELDLDAIASLGAIPSRPMEVGKAKRKAPAKLSISRIGGLPSGVSKKRWPKEEGTPMGFLFQVETEAILQKHAGVAVFCATDGTATEDAELNDVVLLTKAQWKKAPTKAPAVVPVMPVRPLTLGEPKLEVLEERVQAVAADDPELAARFDELQASDRVHDETPWSKVGGAPAWVQDGELDDDWILVAQLDFDGISLKGEWEDAGLFGVIYVAVRKDEKDAVAFWQYT